MVDANYTDSDTTEYLGKVSYTDDEYAEENGDVEIDQHADEVEVMTPEEEDKNAGVVRDSDGNVLPETTFTDKELSDIDTSLNFSSRTTVRKIMSIDVLGYSSHDWRKHTDNAVVGTGSKLRKVNACSVIFKHPKSLKETEVDLSRLIRVFVNNSESHKRSVK